MSRGLASRALAEPAVPPPPPPALTALPPVTCHLCSVPLPFLHLWTGAWVPEALS